MDKDKQVAELIRARRKMFGMTQEEMAAEIGIELQHYQRYEHGVANLSNARMKLGLRICAALEIDPYEAVFENGEDLAGVEREYYRKNLGGKERK